MSFLLIAVALLTAACTHSGGGDAPTSIDTVESTTTAVPVADSLDPDGFYVNLIWHQHQPLYPKDENGIVTRPWVRVHATKDYHDMAAMVRNYPDLRLTFNLTPFSCFSWRTSSTERRTAAGYMPSSRPMT